MSIATVISTASVAARTSSVISNDQDSMVGPVAGAVVLDDSSQVILPADSINDSSERSVLHQLTHHCLLLTTGGEGVWQALAL